MKHILLQIKFPNFTAITSFEEVTDNQYENFQILGEETITNFTHWKDMFDYVITDEKEIECLSFYVCNFHEISTLLSDLRDLRLNKAYDNEMIDEYNKYVGNDESDEIVLK